MSATFTATNGLRTAIDQVVQSLWRAAGFGIGRSRRRRSRDGFGHVENLEARQVMSATPMQIGMNLDNVNDYTPNGQNFAGQRWTPGADFSPFHPLYNERIDDFGFIRFMQLQETNTTDTQRECGLQPRRDSDGDDRQQ